MTYNLKTTNKIHTIPTRRASGSLEQCVGPKRKRLVLWFQDLMLFLTCWPLGQLRRYVPTMCGMISRLYLNWITAVPEKNANWSRPHDNTIHDELMGTFVRQGDSQSYRGELEVRGIGSFYATFSDNPRIQETLVFARSVIAALPKLDAVYRRIASNRLRKWTSVVGNRLASKQEIRQILKFSNAEFWFPAVDPTIGANLWYSAGTLFGGARVCAALNSNRTLDTIAMG